MNGVDLFCGVGGMSLGARRSGISVIRSLDFDRRHIESYNVNYKDNTGRVADIGNLSDEDKVTLFSCNKKIDVVFGGPPCQGFSVGGKQKEGDVRNSLIFSFLEIVELLEPAVFIMENVHGILGKNYSHVVEAFITKAKFLGYHIDQPIVLNSKDFGVPQFRKRVFFVGTKTKQKITHDQIESVYATNKLASPTVKDAISDFEKFESFLDSQNDRIIEKFKCLSKYSEYINNIGADDYFKNQAQDCGTGGFMISDHSDKVKCRFRETVQGERELISRYHRLKWDGISTTLRAGTTRANGQFMASRPIHPSQPRCITVREAARLHSYPDWFEFYPTKWYGNMQIGNSVPPLLAESVITSVINSI